MNVIEKSKGFLYVHSDYLLELCRNRSIIFNIKGTVAFILFKRGRTKNLLLMKEMFCRYFNEDPLDEDSSSSLTYGSNGFL
jgi:hypothetical protein